MGDRESDFIKRIEGTKEFNDLMMASLAMQSKLLILKHAGCAIDEETSKATLSGSFSIPKACPVCLADSGLEERSLKRKFVNVDSSQIGSQINTTTTTTDYSFPIGICPSCSKAIDKGMKRAKSRRSIVGFLLILAFAIAALIAIPGLKEGELGSIIGGAFAFLVFIGFIFPLLLKPFPEPEAYELKKLGGLKRASFVFTAEGAKGDTIELIMPRFANPAYRERFSRDNPVIGFMEANAKVTYD